MKYRIVVITGAGFAGNGAILTPRDSDMARELAIRYATDQFGGVTVSRHTGAWRDSQDKPVTESGYRYEALTDSPLMSGVASETHLRYVRERGRALARYVRSVFQQSSVILYVDEVNAELVS